MNKSLGMCAIMLGLSTVIVFAQQNRAKSVEDAGAQGETLFSYAGPYKMTPAPTLQSDSHRIQIVKVELLEAPRATTLTKITYAPHYGKIETESLRFWKQHETQSVSFLLLGDHTKKVKEGDILRTCFYPN